MISNRIKSNAVKTVAVLMLMIGFSPISNAAPNAIQYKGENRVKTSIMVSKEMKSNAVVFANAYKYPDSLSAYNVAGRYNARLILIDEKTDIESILKNAKATTCYIVGGESSISKNIENKIYKVIPRNNVKRIAGKNRYATNEMTLKEGNYTKVGVADGRNFPDALTASGLLKKEGLGLKLVNGAKPYTASRKVVYTFGGTSSVMQNGGERLAGRNRYETNRRILEKTGQADTVAITTGKNYADALSSINIINAYKNSSILIVDRLNSYQNDFINKANKKFIIGGMISQSDINKINNVDSSTKPEEENTSAAGGGGGGGASGGGGGGASGGGGTSSSENEDSPYTKELKQYKEEKIRKLENLTSLSETELRDFKNKINNSSNKEQAFYFFSEANRINDAHIRKKEENKNLDQIKITSKRRLLYFEELTDEEKTAYKLKIENAKSKEDIDSIITEAIKINSSRNDTREKELNTLRAEGLKKLERFSNIPDEKMKEFKARINTAPNNYEINLALKDANLENDYQIKTKKELNDGKIKGKEELDKLHFISKDDLEDYKTRVDNANDLSSIELITNSAKRRNSYLETDMKDAASSELSGLKHLTSSDVKKYNKRIYNEISGREELESLMDEARNKEAKNKQIQNLKDKVNDILNNSGLLSTEEKNSYFEDIANASSEEEVNSILNEINSLISTYKDELNKAKETAINKLYSLNYISESEKEEYENSINNAPDKDEVQSLITNAVNKDSERQGKKLQKEKNIVIKRLDDFLYLYSSEKQDYIDKIKNASTELELDNIKYDAEHKNQENQDKVTSKRRDAIYELNNMEYLSSEEKSDHESSIYNSYFVEDVEYQINKANYKNEDNKEQCEEARKNAKTVLNNYEYLSNSEYNDYIARINKTIDKDNIDSIVEEAKSRNEENELRENKNKAIKELDDFTHLSTYEKNSYINNINYASDKYEINSILESAEDRDYENQALNQKEFNKLILENFEKGIANPDNKDGKYSVIVKKNVDISEDIEKLLNGMGYFIHRSYIFNSEKNYYKLQYSIYPEYVEYSNLNSEEKNELFLKNMDGIRRLIRISGADRAGTDKEKATTLGLYMKLHYPYAEPRDDLKYHSPYSLTTYGMAVCQGSSYAFNHAMYLFKIPAGVVSGYMPPPNDGSSHMNSMVLYDGYFHELNVTSYGNFEDTDEWRNKYKNAITLDSTSVLMDSSKNPTYTYPSEFVYD